MDKEEIERELLWRMSMFDATSEEFSNQALIKELLKHG